jgi:hypothetical protein
VSSPRASANVAALLKLLGRQPPPPEAPQPLQHAAVAGGGGAAGRPIDWASPDETLTLHAESDDTSARVRLRHTCGAEIILEMAAGGVPKIRLIDCDGVGVKLDPTGLTSVEVDPETGEETETGSTYGPLTVTGCVNGVNQSITVLGYLNA